MTTFIGYHGVTLGRQLNYGGLAVDPDTHLLYSQGSITGATSGLYTVNPTTGVASLVGQFPSTYDNTDGGLAFVGVPEPGSGMLAAMGAMLLALCGRTRRRLVPTASA